MEKESSLEWELDIPEGTEGKQVQEESAGPDTWTIISALDRVLELSHNSCLSESFWKSCREPLSFLNQELGMSDMQIVVLAVLIEFGEPLSWKKMGEFLHCSRLSIMRYSDDIEGLVNKRWLFRSTSEDGERGSRDFVLVPGVTEALRHNRVFVPEKLEGLTEQEFTDKLFSHVNKNMKDFSVSFCDDEEWMSQLVSLNPQIPLCHEILKFQDIHVRSLFLMVVFDYFKSGTPEKEGLPLAYIDDLYPDDDDCGMLRCHLIKGDHVLMHNGFIEYKCEDGIVDTEHIVLTQKTKSDLLSGCHLSYRPERHMQLRDSNLKSYNRIKEKDLFYNPDEQRQIDTLEHLLKVENLTSVQQRLEENGMRKGVACLFHGFPGTGKTETVLQLARHTGRDIVQIDIAGLRDKWVGESEKNIKSIFVHYRHLCEHSEVMPILFFNEADGIFSKRTENISGSADKMDNAMQNIILQELENLEGILIATTNLTRNLDQAFERRFLFKIEFKRPEPEVMARIWRSMLQDISQEAAEHLSSRYVFSGGQIENIARKRTIEYVLSGEMPGMGKIEEYCREETMEMQGGKHGRIGFISDCA